MLEVGGEPSQFVAVAAMHFVERHQHPDACFLCVLREFGEQVAHVPFGAHLCEHRPLQR